MRKRMLSLFAALCLCFTLLPTGAFAEETETETCSHETIGDDGKCTTCQHQMAIKREINNVAAWFDTIAAALDGIRDTESYTIVRLTLYQDVNAGAVLTKDLNLTLYLNGHTLTANVTVTSGGILLSNGDVQTGGKLTGTVTNDGTGMFSTYGDVTISGLVTLAGWDSFDVGTTLQGGVKTVASGRTLLNHLNDGAAFAKSDGSIISGDVTELTGEVKTVAHTHSYDSTTGKCPCGAVAAVCVTGSGVTTGYESFALAYAAAQNGDTIKLLSNVTDTMTISDSSKKITLDLNGKTVSDLTVSVPTTVTDSAGGGTITTLSTTGDVKIGGLLAAGYGFKDTNGKWYDSSSEATSVSNVSVKKLPIKNVSISTDNGKTAYIFGENVVLTANVTRTDSVNATPTYTWTNARNNEFLGEDDASITLDNLAPDEYKIMCTVTVDGYSISKEIQFVVNKVTPTGAPKYTAISTSGKTLADANLTTTGGTFSVEGSVKWVDDSGIVLADTSEVTANTAYKWLFTPTDTANYNTLTGSITLWHRSSGGGSSSNTTSTTVKNPDGSTTTTTTDKTTGTVTETTKNTDGSTTTVETKKDGTVTETNKTASGTIATTVTDKNGNSETTVTVSSKDAASGATVTLPVDEVKPSASKDASEISVEVPKNTSVTVEVPVKNVTSGTVVMIVDEDGKETVIPTTKMTENGVSVTLTENSTIKIVENSKEFSDVKDSDYFDAAVDFASSRGITGGTSDTTFGPHESCTRAQLVTFLWRAAGQPEAKNESGMTDVANDTYYTEAVAWAFENEIVGGYGNGLFGSEDTITREQMATILYRFAQKTGMDITQGGMQVREYDDYDSISNYALSAMQWAVNAGILQGYNNNLMPGQPCTRAQIVTMLYRLLGE